MLIRFEKVKHSAMEYGSTKYLDHLKAIQRWFTGWVIWEIMNQKFTRV